MTETTYTEEEKEIWEKIEKALKVYVTDTLKVSPIYMDKATEEINVRGSEIVYKQYFGEDPKWADLTEQDRIIRIAREISKKEKNMTIPVHIKTKIQSISEFETICDIIYNGLSKKKEKKHIHAIKQEWCKFSPPITGLFYDSDSSSKIEDCLSWDDWNSNSEDSYYNSVENKNVTPLVFAKTILRDRKPEYNLIDIIQKDEKETKLNLTQIEAFKICEKSQSELFGYTTNTWIKLEEFDVLNPRLKKLLETELSYFNKLGLLVLTEEPEIGDRCYFWNGNDKLDSTIDHKPYIDTLIRKNEGKYESKHHDFIFKFAQKVEGKEQQ